MPTILNLGGAGVAELAGTATASDVFAGKTFYSTDAETMETGTYSPSITQWKNGDYAAITNQEITATNCIGYGLSIVKAETGSASYAPSVTLQGYTGSAWENISVSLTGPTSCAGGSGGGNLRAWHAMGTFNKRYTKVRLSRPQNSVYACCTQIFLFT